MKSIDIYKIFDIDGVLSQQFKNYEFREGQLEMSLAVMSSYEKNAIAALEAGTGIGKSFAYLVPAIFWAIEHPDEKTVIATSTINLQRQLYDKDIEQLFKNLHVQVPVSLLMGRNNYLCQRRLEMYAGKFPLIAQDSTSDIALLFDFSHASNTGLRSDIPYSIDYRIWSEVCSDVDNCIGYKCSYYSECFYFNSKKQAAKASIIITNHHLLFTDAQARLIEELGYDETSVLPPFQKLVIDEAHNIEKNATDYFTHTYSSYHVMKSIDKLSSKSSNGNTHLVDMLLKVIPNEYYSVDIAPLFATVVERVGYLEIYLQDFLRGIKVHKLLVYTTMEKQMERAISLSHEVEDALEALLIALRKIISYPKLPTEYDIYINDLYSHIGRLQFQKEVVHTFFLFDKDRFDVFWMEHLESKEVYLHISPLSVAQKLKQSIFEGLDTVILTSATLDLHDDFAFWGNRIGLPLESDKPYMRLAFSSPFDYKKNLLFLTSHDAPLFSEKESDTYYEYCTEAIIDALLSSQGGALVLFTSYSMLKRVAFSCEKALKDHNLTLLRQGDMDRSTLLKTFIEDKDSVLFATDSFWEGVDAPGDTLRVVIIVKLPFRVPNEPIFRARMESLDNNGKSGFFHLSLPEATMRLKQGFGRLLRHTGDRGIVLILDSRIVQKRYGKWMVHALPESYYQETGIDMIGEKIELFLYQ